MEEETNVQHVYEYLMEALSQFEDTCIEKAPEGAGEIISNIIETAAESLIEAMTITTGFCPCCGDTPEVVEQDTTDEVMNIGVEMDTEDGESRIRLNLYADELMTTTVWFDCKKEEIHGMTHHEVSTALIDALRELALVLERRAK